PVALEGWRFQPDAAKGQSIERYIRAVDRFAQAPAPHQGQMRLGQMRAIRPNTMRVNPVAAQVVDGHQPFVRINILARRWQQPNADDEQRADAHAGGFLKRMAERSRLRRCVEQMNVGYSPQPCLNNYDTFAVNTTCSNAVQPGNL